MSVSYKENAQLFTCKNTIAQLSLILVVIFSVNNIVLKQHSIWAPVGSGWAPVGNAAWVVYKYLY